jgi:hypothetical protein
MASRSADEPSASSPHAIIPFVPRQRVRQCVQALLTALVADEDRARARRMIADARATFGDDLVAELQHGVEHRSFAYGIAAIHVLLELASPIAQEALGEIARDATCHPALRLEALRGLYQQGAEVPLSQLVALANQCERAPRPRECDLP